MPTDCYACLFSSINSPHYSIKRDRPSLPQDTQAPTELNHSRQSAMKNETSLAVKDEDTTHINVGYPIIFILTFP